MSSWWRATIITAGFALLAGACALWSLARPVDNPPMHGVSTRGLTASLAAANAGNMHHDHDDNVKAITPQHPLPALPATLAGLTHDVHLEVDANGHLVLKSDNIHLLDFYLAGNDEESMAIIRQRTDNDIILQLERYPQALAEALSLAAHYWSYRTALEWLPSMGDNHSAWALEQQYEHLKNIRQQYFSAPEINAYFSDEDQQYRYTIDTLAIQQNEQLSPGEKQQAMAALDAQQPEVFMRNRHEVTDVADVQAQAQQLRHDGADDERIFQLRAATLGNDAAQALATLDIRQTDWQQRLNAFAEQHARINAAEGSAGDKQQQINALLEKTFEPTERAHALAYVEFR